MNGMKKCFKCGAVKNLSEFYRHSKMADGHLNKCKVCTRKDVMRHRSENIDAIRAYDRERGRVRTASLVQGRGEALKSDVPLSVRRASRIILGNSVRDGRIVPWPVCAIPDCNKKPEAHHPDYYNPLGVVWLCKKHHRATHLTIFVKKE